MTSKEKKKIKEYLFDIYNGRCAYCGTPMKKSDTTIDHVVPVQKGGSDEIENLLPACKYCNNKKANLSLEEFRELIKSYHQIFRQTTKYKFALRFATINPFNGQFYFETLNLSKNSKHDIIQMNLSKKRVIPDTVKIAIQIAGFDNSTDINFQENTERFEKEIVIASKIKELIEGILENF